MTPGRFITFEGIDGSGKTTQLRMAERFLQEQGVPHIVTREPGGTPVAEMIRELILCPDHEEMVDSCEVLLYLAARAQHVHEKIHPALREGTTVLCDRFAQATFAYQGYGRGLALEELAVLNEFATGGLSPSLTFIVDVPVDTALERMRAMGKVQDRLERSDRAFHERVREGYHRQADALGERVVLLDGRRSIEELAGEVREHLALRLGVACS
jgi:dTMP kinase